MLHFWPPGGGLGRQEGSDYIYIYISLSLSLSFCLSVCLSVCLSIYPPVYLQAWKLSNSARLPHFSTVTTSKTNQFYETPAVFELDNIKNKAILRDFLQKWKVKCSADSLVPMRFAIFPLHLSKVLRLPRKIDARSYEVLHLSRKIILANLQIWCSKMQPLSGNQRPDLLTSLMNMSFVLRLPQKMHLCRSSSNASRPPWFLEMWQTLTFCSLLTRCTIPCACHARRHLNLQRWREHVVFWCVLYILTSKCASCHNGVHFFDISTSKSGPSMVCFVHFDFEMCFAPQRRALFRHRNFQKWSDTEVLLAVSLTNVLRATTACTFSSLIWPDGSAPAALASLLFDPPESQIIGKTQWIATFLPFRASASSFFWLFLFFDLLSSTLLFSLPLPSSAFHLSILSEVWLLNFLWWYIHWITLMYLNTCCIINK